MAWQWRRSADTAHRRYPKTRRIRFRFNEEAEKKYFVDGDMVYSHFVAGLSGGFPPGEEGFIRSVRRFADRITDPDLKKRVAGFIGQESMHGQEHRHLNEKLVEMGYPIEWWDSKRLKARQIRLEERLPARVHLAMTAAAEHYTAVLAERVLSSDEIQSIPAEPEMWHLLNWHALEELEHKSVAFDVYRAVGGTERTRIAVMAVMYALTLPLTLVSLSDSLRRDPIARRQPRRLLKRGVHPVHRSGVQGPDAGTRQVHAARIPSGRHRHHRIACSGGRTNSSVPTASSSTT